MMSFPRSERLPRKMRPITLRWHEESGDGRFGRRRQVSPDGAGAYPQNQLPPPLAGRPGRVVEAAHAIDVFGPHRAPPMRAVFSAFTTTCMRGDPSRVSRELTVSTAIECHATTSNVFARIAAEPRVSRTGFSA